MNLYNIRFVHIAPGSNEHGIKCLLLAESDEDVYDWIASQPDTIEGTLYNSWKDNELVQYNSYTEEFEDIHGDITNGWYDNNNKLENFKVRMLRLNGEIMDDAIDCSDSYGGITLYGWELLKQNTTVNYSELIELKLVFQYISEKSQNNIDDIIKIEF